MCDSLLQFLYTWLSVTGSEATARELEMNQIPLLKSVWRIWQISQAGVKCWHVITALLPTLKPIKPQMMFGALWLFTGRNIPCCHSLSHRAGIDFGSHYPINITISEQQSHGLHRERWRSLRADLCCWLGQGFLGQFVHKSGPFFFLDVCCLGTCGQIRSTTHRLIELYHGSFSCLRLQILLWAWPGLLSMTSRGRVCSSGTHGWREPRRVDCNRTVIAMLTLLLSYALHPFALCPGFKVLAQGWTSLSLNEICHRPYWCFYCH